MKKYSLIITFLFLFGFNSIEAADSFKISVKPSETKATITTSCIICTFEDSKYNGTVSVSDNIVGGSGYFQMKSVFFDKTKPITLEFTNLKKDITYKILVSANGIPSTTTTFKINTPKPPVNPPVVKTELQKVQDTYNEAKAEYEKNPTAQNLEYLNTATKNLEEAKKKGGIGSGEPAVEINANQQVTTSDRTTYNLLAPLPGLKSIKTNDIGQYFNIIFNIAIGICGVLAVIMLIIHGVSYMTSESFTEKAELKKKIWGPIGGLLLALGAYAILNTIDPALTGKEGLNVDQVSAALENIEGDAQAEVAYKSYVSSGKPGNGITGYDFKNAKFPSGIICPSKGMGSGDITTIAKSFKGKITYAQLEKPPKGPRGTPTQTGHFFLDCSSYVTTVLKCAGINPPSYAVTTQLFASAEPTTANKIKVQSGEGYINDIKLEVGDLVGWKVSDSKKGSGHVIMYIGNGQVIDSHGGKGRNPGLSVTGPFSLEFYKNQIKWVKRLSTYTKIR